ncbi:hypothetical protein BCR35DRAFT_331659 [Leucosporidium creatinivorum]|uniref:Uncharacterized protein n=1 Tax=Leucosporidium creatinivorum TaxID=106004 RepID=A0A1Y2FBG4_9BASI|nr:hypothetical protein BCR35DRAFT_331659 [Leucosporidium creatinivorum]
MSNGAMHAEGYSKLSTRTQELVLPLGNPHRRRHRLLWVAIPSLLTLALLSLASLHPRSQEQLKRLSHYTIGRQYKTAVGPRSYQHLYQGCNLTELLLDLKQSRIKEDAPSKYANFTVTPYVPEDNAPPPFAGFSFDLDTCPPPHVFTREEACDLIGSFGALILSGDSFIRHVWDALLIFLTNDLSGAVVDPQHCAQCRGEHLFNDRELSNFTALTPCRLGIYDELESLPGDVCRGREVRGKWLTGLTSISLPSLLAYIASLPPASQQRSPVLLFGAGVHGGYSLNLTAENFILPVLNLNSRFSPHIVPIWQSSHAPGDNVATPYYNTQGRAAVKKYIAGVERIIQNNQKVSTVSEGSLLCMSWYTVTEGADSFDGQHYSYQVNTEKMYTLLTVLDLVWHEIEAAGGLVD